MTLSKPDTAAGSTNKLKWVLPLLICLLLAAVCAWIFGSAMQSTYPQGILVFPAAPGMPEQASDAFYIGMALGGFFFSLIYGAMTVSIYLLNRLKITPLQHLTIPLLLAFICCSVFCVLCVVLAN